MLPHADRGVLAVTESERVSWLDGIVTCDVADLEPGQGRYGLLLSKVGKIQTDLDIVATPEAVYLGTAPGTIGSVRDFLDAYLIMEDAELDDQSAERALVRLHGPRAAELAQATEGVEAASLDWTGRGGQALIVARDEVDAVVTKLVEAGAVRAEPGDWDRLRIEAQLPTFGVDYDDRHNPHQASLDRRAVSWSKGCYLGQEVVCTLDMRGKVRRRLYVLSVDGGDVPEPGTPVTTVGGDAAGEVTSAAAGDPVLVFARLERKRVEAAEALRVGSREAALFAEPPSVDGAESRDRVPSA